MKKIFWFDTETTGLNSYSHAMIQIAYLIDIDGKVVADGVLKVKPFKGDLVSKEALDLLGLKMEDLLNYPDPEEAYRAIVGILSAHVDKFDRTDYFIPGGFNVGFDIDFLSRFFEKNNDKYLGSFIDRRRALDPRALLSFFDYSGKIRLQNYKLKTVADHFGIAIDNHDPASDVAATRNIFYSILHLFAKGLDNASAAS